MTQAVVALCQAKDYLSDWVDMQEIKDERDLTNKEHIEFLAKMLASKIAENAQLKVEVEWSVDDLFVTLPAPEQIWRLTYQKRLYDQGYTKHDAHESAKAAEYDSEIDPIEAADDEVSYE